MIPTCDASSTRRCGAGGWIGSEQRILRVLVGLAALCVVICGNALHAQTLDEQLRQLPPAELARQAREFGDAPRGAVVFHQPHMACAKCHSVGSSTSPVLGPDLAISERKLTDEELVESILLPSKVVRKEYEPVVVVTVDGRTFQGLLVEKSNERVVVRDASRDGVSVTLSEADVAELSASAISLMPAGQVNQLASRQQFLDLVRYLIEIRDGGAARARSLQPSPTLLTLALPEYEQRLDHAGFLRDWDEKSLKRGELIYRRVCANCHGTHDQPGSLPTAPRFAEAQFKNGSDPYAMYQTLTRGFGMMAAQNWMVPIQKYDVIHYVRETFLRRNNPRHYLAATAEYLNTLPTGDTRGPEPSRIEPWSAMDYGPSLTHTYEIPGEVHNFAYKGTAVRLDVGAGGVSRGRHWMVFESDTLRVAAGWTTDGSKEDFINWRGIQFNGEHQIHPSIAGRIVFQNSDGPGWADPETGSFHDAVRVVGRDGRRYGPLPGTWAKFRGLYHFDQQVIFSYTVGDAPVLESPRWISSDPPGARGDFVRLFDIGRRDKELELQVLEHAGVESAVRKSWANAPAVRGEGLPPELPVLRIRGGTTDLPTVVAGVISDGRPFQWSADGARLRLKIPPGADRRQFGVWISAEASETNQLGDVLPPRLAPEDLDLARATRGGPARWPQRITTHAVTSVDQGPFAVDVLAAPVSNPWLAQTRFTGLDFFSDGRIAVCTWDGDVWVVESAANSTELAWQRVASGMFQPLGLKIMRDKIHVLCRDQLAVLHDLNGDGETDFYECLNNDHQVTEHFHEFAMGLQTDADGNFYYAKSARHALRAVVPHHGTLLRVSRDGSRTEILANGFRAANGVCLNPDGSFVVTDQEGHWNPKNRINWVTRDPSGTPKFYGNLYGYTDVSDSADSAMEPPLCWITNKFDRSPAELLWVESDRWGPLRGSLLNLSYGYGRVFVVPHERVQGVMQGGMLQLPLPDFPTGIMRGRFHPADGQLYVCGMFAWAGNAAHPGGLYRIRATGRPMHLISGLNATKSGLKLHFTEPLDAASIQAGKIRITTWSLRRTADYGSKHYDEKQLSVAGVSLSEDGRSVSVLVPDIRPTWCMEIGYEFRAAGGEPVAGVIHNTIHALSD